MLEKLFTSKNRVKILNFFLFEENETHLREIARKLKISPSAVKREIDNLKSINILETKKNKTTINKKCPFLQDLKNIFIKTDSIIYPLKETLKNKKIKFAFLFGSFARGEPSSESDVDLMIIGDIDSYNIYKKIRPVEDKIKRDIKPVVWTLNNFKKEKNSSFIKDILKKGILMIKGDENELRKIIK